MSQYFPKPYEPFVKNINVKVDLSYYATKEDIKNISHVDKSSFALKTNLVISIIDISNLAIKTALTTVENKIPNVSNLVKKQTITLKLEKLKINLIIIIMINILILKSLIN